MASRFEPGGFDNRKFQDGASELRDQSHAFSQRDEIRRIQHAAGRMFPTNQRLDARYFGCMNVQGWLIVQSESALVDCRPELVNESETLAAVWVVFGAVPTNQTLSALGFVHSDISTTKQFVMGGPMLRGNCDADTGSHTYRYSIKSDSGCEACDELVRDSNQVVLGPDCQDAGKLISSDASKRTEIVDVTGEAFGDHAEKLVAGVMAKRVVDFLESIEIDEKDADV